jgi:hypothetical protein
MEQQRMCAAQAEHVFRSGGWSLAGAAVNGIIGAYSNHYNTRLGRCFMVMSTTSPHNAFSTLVLTDAFEGTTYGSFYSSWSANGGTVVAECDLTIPNSEAKQCSSREQWLRLISPFIETGTLY